MSDSREVNDTAIDELLEEWEWELASQQVSIATTSSEADVVDADTVSDQLSNEENNSLKRSKDQMLPGTVKPKQRKQFHFPSNDPRRQIINQFCEACNAVDAKVLLKFFRNYTTEDVMFRLISKMSRPPYDLINPDLIFRGQVKACEFLYARLACVPDILITPESERTKYFFRVDGSMRIVAALKSVGSPMISSQAILSMEQNILKPLPLPSISSDAGDVDVDEITATAITKRVNEIIAQGLSVDVSDKRCSTKSVEQVSLPSEADLSSTVPTTFTSRSDAAATRLTDITGSSCSVADDLKGNLSSSILLNQLQMENDDIENQISDDELQSLMRLVGFTCTLLVNRDNQIFSMEFVLHPWNIQPPKQSRKL